MTLKFSVTPAGLAWLSQAFPEATAISPLRSPSGNPADVDEEVTGDLLSQGVIESDGTITPQALAPLQLLAKSEKFARIRVRGTSSPLDKVVYFADGIACSVDATVARFEIQYPAMNQEAGYFLSELTGSSRLVNVPFAVTLPETQATTLLALVDLVRYGSLAALAGRTASVSFTLDEILAQLSAAHSFLSLSKTLESLTAGNGLVAADISAALQALTVSGHVQHSEGRFFLQGAALELATTFLIPDYIFDLSFGTVLSAESVEQSSCSIVFCGMHNLLYVDATGEGVTLETISGSDALGMLLTALTEIT